MFWKKNEPNDKPNKNEKSLFYDKTAKDGGPYDPYYLGEYDPDTQTWIDDEGNTVDDADVGFWARLFKP